MAIVLKKGVASTATASGPIGEGQIIRITSTGQVAPCDINAADAQEAAAVGLALTGGIVGDQIVFAPNGTEVDVGSPLNVGDTYCVSAISGLATRASLTTGQWITHVGVPSASNRLPISILATGTQVP